MTRDHHRRNELSELGWTVLVFTWLDVTREPERVLATVRRARARSSMEARHLGLAPGHR